MLPTSAGHDRHEGTRARRSRIVGQAEKEHCTMIAASNVMLMEYRRGLIT